MQPGAASEPDLDAGVGTTPPEVEGEGLPQTVASEEAPPPKNTKMRGRKTRPARGVQFR